MKRTLNLLIRFSLTAAVLIMVAQGVIWPRFKDIVVNDPEGEVNPEHNVESYWDDDLEKEVRFSWYVDDLDESFLMQAASWEALDIDQRRVITITASREPCKE